MESNTLDRSFHLFPQLPANLRLFIWGKCLPCRVVEIDYAIADYAYLCRDPPPCTLRLTSEINRQPPVISRVCRESRRVAFKSGHHYQLAQESPPLESKWICLLEITNAWIDPSRDTIHLNWTPCYEVERPVVLGDGSALDYLSWRSRQARGGSFMYDYLDNHHDGDVDIKERIGALQQFRNGVVVMHIIVVHATFDAAAKTGLFGLLGDACIQLVDVSDEARLNAFYDFAEKCESKTEGFTSRPQDFRRQSPEQLRKALRDKLADTFWGQAAEDLPQLSPVIMFRFCPRWCNHVLPLPRRTFRAWRHCQL